MTQETDSLDDYEIAVLHTNFTIPRLPGNSITPDVGFSFVLLGDGSAMAIGTGEGPYEGQTLLFSPGSYVCSLKRKEQSGGKEARKRSR